MKMIMMKKNYQLGDYEAVHQAPVWRERANFIIAADLAQDVEHHERREWEQLWARRIQDFRFELCCIPFFVYDLALGDEVETNEEYVIQRVVKPSGHYTFRVWFGESNAPTVRDEVTEMVQRLGCELEWSSKNLLAIDAATDTLAQAIADFLNERAQIKGLTYETGRTNARPIESA